MLEQLKTGPKKTAKHGSKPSRMTVGCLNLGPGKAELSKRKPVMILSRFLKYKLQSGVRQKFCSQMDPNQPVSGAKKLTLNWQAALQLNRGSFSLAYRVCCFVIVILIIPGYQSFFQFAIKVYLRKCNAIGLMRKCTHTHTYKYTTVDISMHIFRASLVSRQASAPIR